MLQKETAEVGTESVRCSNLNHFSRMMISPEPIS